MAESNPSRRRVSEHLVSSSVGPNPTLKVQRCVWEHCRRMSLKYAAEEMDGVADKFYFCGYGGMGYTHAQGACAF